MSMRVEQALTGIGVGLAATVILPLVKPAITPVLNAGRVGAMVAGNEVRKRFSFLREEIEDLAAEVQFERLRKRIDREIGGS